MFRLEHHWYRITPLHLILIPLSLVFRVLVAFRRVLYRDRILASDQLLIPVIVVGNISVGGTGKTPLTLALAQQLIALGWHPLIVSRGYKSASQHPQQVEPGMTAQQAGDEPLLMARRNLCPVWVGKDRAATARAAPAAGAGGVGVAGGGGGRGSWRPPPRRPGAGAGLATANGGCGGG